MEKKASTSQASGMKFVRPGLILCLTALMIGTLNGCADSNIIATQAKSASSKTGSAEGDTSGAPAAGDSDKANDPEDSDKTSKEAPSTSSVSDDSTNENADGGKSGAKESNTSQQQANKPSARDKTAPEKETKKESEKGAVDPDAPAANDPVHPFPQRISIPDFPKDMEWLNVGGPLRKQDLKGKFVLLDFWTYCCINCIHILPELKKLEQAYPNQLVVIGVHSAKFETEKGSKNIEEAILRYEIEHPVVNDADHKIWDIYGVRSWPTAVLVDPEGNAVWMRSGEFEAEEIDERIKMALPYYRANKSLDETPVRFELAAGRQKPTPLRFPGKVLADEAGGRLFISDSNHNRIVIAGFDGKLIATIGSGAIGRADGNLSSATFDHPQGMALVNETLYVADTENHLLRKVDLKGKQVTTIAGIGEQGRGWPGQDKLAEGDRLPTRWVGKPKETALNSPWDLCIHKDDLYIAMAGSHQIWKMPLDESEIGPYAGNGREDIVDGPLLSSYPYEQGYSSFAQPSGLSSDANYIYVADSEGSSIRAVPFDPGKEVLTVVGTSELPFNRLFHFGDKDGPREQVLLQHCLGVAHHDGQLYVADTYNNKIKVVNAKTGETKTVAGSGQPGADDARGQFDEPSGIAWAQGLLYVTDTNNHALRTVDPTSGKVATLTIDGLQPPERRTTARTPDFSRAPQVSVKEKTVSAQAGEVKLSVSLKLPKGWKINDLAPMRCWLEATGDAGPIPTSSLGEKKIEPPAASFSLKLPAEKSGRTQLRVALVYYYCQEGGEGLCKTASVVWNVPLVVDANASSAEVPLQYEIPE